MSIYAFLIALATLPVLYFGARWSWLALPDRWRYKLRLAARRVYLVGPLAALSLMGCDAGGLLLVGASSGGGGATTGPTQTTSSSSGGLLDAGPDVKPDAAVPACSGLPCPVGSYDQCEPGDSVTACCQGSTTFEACSRPAGILLNQGLDGGSVCPAACIGEPCALSPGGMVTCCVFVGMSAGACDVDGGA